MTGWDGTGVDPWLPVRLRRNAAVAAAERDVFHRLWAELSAWLVKVRRGVLPSAALPPEPTAVWAFLPDWEQIVQQFVTGPILDVFGIGFRKVFGPDFRYDDRPAAIAHLATVANRMVRTPDEVFNLIATSIAEGAGLGEGIRDLAARINRLLTVTETEIWRNRATTVARTETLGAFNAGRSDMFTVLAADIGGDFEKMWLATDDTRTRKSHREADGQRVPVGMPFTVGADEELNLIGVQLMQPGDPSGPANEVINCLTDPATPILTAEGPRPVAAVRPGSLVVTHRGRLRPVLRLAAPRIYSGPVVRVETAAGVLRVTPNHPVLTREGWVVAGELRPGMVVFRAAPVQRRNRVVGGGLLGVHGVVRRASAAAGLRREAEEDVRLRRLDHEERPHGAHDVDRLPGGRLPSAHPRPVLAGRGLVPVNDADAGRLVKEPHNALVTVRHHDSRLVVIGAGGSVDAAAFTSTFADRDDALAVDHRGDVGSSDGVHSMMVPLTVITSSVEDTRGVRLYNFAVADDESYIAGGVAVHNCRCTTLLVRPGEELDYSDRGWKLR